MELKEFQLNAVKSLFEAMDKPVRDIILKSPTGSGKTIILTYFMHQYIQSYPKTVFVWLTPGKGNLEEQSKAKMDKYIHASQTKLLSDVMTAGFEENDSCFINWEKLTKKGNNALKDSERTNFLEHIEHALNDGLRFIIIVDESHQNNTIKADEIIQYFRTEKIIRCSATPKGIAKAEVIEIPEEEVIAAGLIKKMLVINQDFPQTVETEDQTAYLLERALQKQRELRAAYLQMDVDINPLIIVQIPNKSETLLDGVERWFEAQGLTYENGQLAVWLSDRHENLEGIDAPAAPSTAVILEQIEDKHHFSFSAPTSTGKSFVFRNLIRSASNDVVVIVPSRALINEYYDRIREIVNVKEVNVLTFVDRINTKFAKRNIFILTPERSRELFKNKSWLNIDLILFDEAQLSDEKSVRGLYFDSIVRRALKSFSDAKYVFAHPFISNPEAQLQRNGIIDTQSAAINYEQKNVSDEYNLPSADVEKLHSEDVTAMIPQLLDMMFDNEKIISPDSDMKEVNDLFSKLYQQYLGRKLCQAEKSVLSTAVRIMIWKIYGKTFHRICQYRYAYASRTTERQQLYRKGDVEAANSIPAKYIVGYHDIPDKDLTPYPLISTSISAKDVDYDLIVYDTYDYLDKLIGFKLSDIFYAVFYQYYEATSDECALRLAKYFKYGTDKEREIWMLRYGFSFEETELVSECIDFIDETEIKFNDRINALNEAQLQVIEQYVHE